MRFGVGIALNLNMVILEVIFGIIANSISLIADAGHDLSDVLGLGVAFAATIASRPRAFSRFTYGLKATSILAALFNGVFLLVAPAPCSYAAIERFFQPQPVATAMMMTVAAIGIVANGLTAALFVSGRKHDLNVRGAFLHMTADAGLVGRRRHRGPRHCIDWPALARSIDEPHHQWGHLSRDMGAFAREPGDVARRSSRSG